MQELRDQVVLDIHDSDQQIREDVCLDPLVCAGRVGLNQAKKCFDGTRIEILDKIIDWIDNSDPSTPRIFRLHRRGDLPLRILLLSRPTISSTLVVVLSV